MEQKEISDYERRRYSRHINLEEIGITGQLKVKRCSVLVIGIGGLGSVTTSLLTRAGIGRLGMVDSDKISLSDLQRQILYTTHDIGKQKVLIAQQYLHEINPDVNIEAHNARFCQENAESLVNQYNIIIDGTDNLETRQLINRVCCNSGKPFIFGAVDQFYGQASIFWKGRGPCFACLQSPEKNHATQEGEPTINVLSPLVLMIGAVQTNEAVKLITGVGSPLIGELLTINALDMHFQKNNIPQRENCPICG